MADVQIHFITAEGQAHTAADAQRTAAMLARSLGSQGLKSCATGTTVNVSVPEGQQCDAAEIFVLCDEGLLSGPTMLHQFDGHTAVVINSPRPATVLRHELGRFTGGVAAVDAAGIAEDEGSDSMVALLGVIARLVPFIDPEALSTAVWHNYDRTFPYAARAASKVFDLGYMQAQQALGS